MVLQYYFQFKTIVWFIIASNLAISFVKFCVLPSFQPELQSRVDLDEAVFDFHLIFTTIGIVAYFSNKYSQIEKILHCYLQAVSDNVSTFQST